MYRFILSKKGFYPSVKSSCKQLFFAKYVILAMRPRYIEYVRRDEFMI